MQKQTERIFLIGYMGAGKTTLGKALAEALGMQFIDLDVFIENRQHKTISDIFAAVGEDAFRHLEQTALQEVTEYENVVIALGGGTPCFFDNMSVVNASGISVYLKPSESVLLDRLTKAKQKRPIIAQKTNDELLEFIRQSLAKRESYYKQARLLFDADKLESKSQIADSVEALKQMLEAYKNDITTAR